MRKVTKVYGKLYKISKSLAKEVVNEAKKSVFRELIKLGIDYAQRLIEQIM